MSDNNSGNDGTGRSEQRRRGLEMMGKVYGFDQADGTGAYFEHTLDHVFGDVWAREGLTIRERRLLLFGAVAATGQWNIAEVQAGAALANGEVTPEQLHEIALFLCYYAGWPMGTQLEMTFGKAIYKHKKALKEKEAQA